MVLDLWSSLGLGVGIGLVYGAASYATYRLALSASTRKFLLLVWGGMILRMFVALGILVLIMISVAVVELALIGSFFAVFAVVLVLEVYGLHRAGAAPPRVEN